MSTRSFSIAVVTLMLLSPTLAEKIIASGQECRTKTNRFAVKCPSKWYLLSATETGIDILSFPSSERLEGVTIKDGGAEIIVEMAPSDIPDIESWMARDKKLLDSSKPIDMRLRSTSCHATQVVDGEIKMADNSIERDISVYCNSDRHRYRFLLRAWKKDPKWGVYKRVLQEIVRSFKEKTAVGGTGGGGDLAPEPPNSAHNYQW